MTKTVDSVIPKINETFISIIMDAPLKYNAHYCHDH